MANAKKVKKHKDDTAKATEKKETADYLVEKGGLSQADANKAAKIQVSATNQEVAESVKDAIK